MIKYYIKGNYEDAIVFYTSSSIIDDFIIHDFSYSQQKAKLFLSFDEAKEILKKMPNKSFKIYKIKTTN